MLLKWLHVAGKASASNASIPQSLDSMELTTVVASLILSDSQFGSDVTALPGQSQEGSPENSRIYQIGIIA
jgi:hypothetical protein